MSLSYENTDLFANRQVVVLNGVLPICLLRVCQPRYAGQALPFANFLLPQQLSISKIFPYLSFLKKTGVRAFSRGYTYLTNAFNKHIVLIVIALRTLR